ncbi:MFS transporter [Pediococcus pentosaceus]|uniref:MFS transporter n=1 Tax=Pediococcus pentosaceus TaxID=1255 RepID=UPI0020748DE0|nr:MFS transporter [Pediococcus pentosaceus]MCM6819642.1 MFS transporter [Pediococcus pentosaceus]
MMNKEYNPKSLLFKIAILSISIDATVAGVISGAIPLLADSFKSYPTYVVESVPTIPNLTILIFVVLSSFFTKILGYKKTVLTGLLLSFISGVAPFFLHNLYLILLMRALFGAGVGMINPLSYSIISYFYEGDIRAKMYGLISTVSNFASVMLTILAGVLLQYSWRFSFLTYFILLIVFVLVLFLVPDFEINSNSEKDQEDKKRALQNIKLIDRKVLVYGFCMFILFSVFMTINIKLGLLVTGKGYGDATQVSFLLSLSNLTGIFIVIIFGVVYKYLKNILFPIALLVMGITYFLIANSNSIILTGVLIVIIAAAFIFLSTFIFLRVSELAPKSMNNFVSSMMLVAINLGAFLCPYFMQGISSLSGNNTPQSALIICGIIVLMLLVGYVLSSLFIRNKNI